MGNSLNIIPSNHTSLFSYIKEINKIDMLTEKEEILYATEKDKGDINAAKMLVSSYLRLVVKIAYGYKNYGLPIMDLISEGNIGLIRAVKTFDYTKGYKLATYALWWVKAYIQEYILKSWSIVKIGTSASQKKLFFNLRKIKNEILLYTNKKYLSNKDVKKISETLNISEQNIVEMDSRLSQSDVYLNKKTNNEDGDEIINLIPSKLALQDTIIDAKRTNQAKSKILIEAMDLLSVREKEIITLRRLSEEPMTLSEISKKCNISGERVRQIENKAIEKMQDYIKNYGKY